MLRYITTIIFLLSFALFADQKIDALVDQLGAASYKDRKKAEQTLWELLPASEAALRKAVLSEDPEINARAGRILEKFEKGILPGVTEEIKQKIDGFWVAKNKALYLRDWLYSSELKDLRHVIHLIKLSERKGDPVRIRDMNSRRDLISNIYTKGSPEEYKFFIQKYAEQGDEEIYLNWVAANNKIQDEIAHYEALQNDSGDKYKGLLQSLYKIAGNKAKAEELAKGDAKRELSLLIENGNYEKILSHKKYIQSQLAIGEDKYKLLFRRLSGDKEQYKLDKQSFIDEYASRANKTIHLNALHALISNGELEEAEKIAKDLEPLWYVRILILQKDIKKTLAFAKEEGDSQSAAFTAFEYSKLFKKEECISWLEKAKFSELSGRWLYFYAKAYAYAYGLEAAFEFVVENFEYIPSNSRHQIYYALCPDFSSLASYVIGYRRGEYLNNFILLKKFVLKQIEGEELSDFYQKVGSNNGRISEYRVKLVHEAARYLNDREKLKNYKEEYLKYDSNKISEAKRLLLLEDYKGCLKILKEVKLKDIYLKYYLYLSAKSYQGLDDKENFAKYIVQLKKSPTSSYDLSEDFLEFLTDLGDTDLATYFLKFFQYRSVLNFNLIEKLIDHFIDIGDYKQARYYSVQYYLNRNKNSLYLYPVHSMRVYLNFLKVDCFEKLAKKQVKESLAVAEKTLDLAPFEYDFHVEFINQLKKSSFQRESDAHYKKYMNQYIELIKISDKNSTALNDWAWSAVLCNRDLDEAEKKSRAAIELTPGNANLLDTLAEILFKKGKVQEAVKIQAEACELVSDAKFAEFRAKHNRFKASFSK